MLRGGGKPGRACSRRGRRRRKHRYRRATARTSSSSVSSFPNRLRTCRGRSVARLVVVTGRRRRAACAARLTACGDDLPGKGGAVEAVGVVVAVDLACRRV